jgi:2-pyrone-4,6-dicarboxylate lactonase
MDEDWLVFNPSPSPPSFVLPPGAVDAHCHIFGPGDVFPFAAERKYTPCDAPKEKLWALRDYLGFERNVIVQATCHGTDNRALLDALKSAAGRARGVASVQKTVTDEMLQVLHDAGVRGVRFNFVKRLVDALSHEALAEIAERISLLGWHTVIYFESQDLAQLYDFISSLPGTVVVDHMGRPDVGLPVDGAEFELFLKLPPITTISTARSVARNASRVLGHRNTWTSCRLQRR